MSEQQFEKALASADKAQMEIAWLDEHKGKNITALSVNNSLTDIVIIVTSSSVRHGKSLADGLVQFCKENKIEYFGKEGYDAGTWILVDLNDVIVHILSEESRELYNLEGLLRDAEPFLLQNRS